MIAIRCGDSEWELDESIDRRECVGPAGPLSGTLYDVQFPAPLRIFWDHLLLSHLLSDNCSIRERSSSGLGRAHYEAWIFALSGRISVDPHSALAWRSHSNRIGGGDHRIMPLGKARIHTSSAWSKVHGAVPDRSLMAPGGHYARFGQSQRDNATRPLGCARQRVGSTIPCGCLHTMVQL
jgi:hypothetical protein